MANCVNYLRRAGYATGRVREFTCVLAARPEMLYTDFDEIFWARTN